MAVPMKILSYIVALAMFGYGLFILIACTMVTNRLKSECAAGSLKQKVRVCVGMGATLVGLALGMIISGIVCEGICKLINGKKAVYVGLALVSAIAVVVTIVSKLIMNELEKEGCGMEITKMDEALHYTSVGLSIFPVLVMIGMYFQLGGSLPDWFGGGGGGGGGGGNNKLNKDSTAKMSDLGDEGRTVHSDAVWTEKDEDLVKSTAVGVAAIQAKQFASLQRQRDNAMIRQGKLQSARDKLDNKIRHETDPDKRTKIRERIFLLDQNLTAQINKSKSLAQKSKQLTIQENSRVVNPSRKQKSSNNSFGGFGLDSGSLYDYEHSG